MKDFPKKMRRKWKKYKINQNKNLSPATKTRKTFQPFFNIEN